MTDDQNVIDHPVEEPDPEQAHRTPVTIRSVPNQVAPILEDKPQDGHHAPPPKPVPYTSDPEAWDGKATRVTVTGLVNRDGTLLGPGMPAGDKFVLKASKTTIGGVNGVWTGPEGKHAAELQASGTIAGTPEAAQKRRNREKRYADWGVYNEQGNVNPILSDLTLSLRDQMERRAEHDPRLAELLRNPGIATAIRQEKSILNEVGRESNDRITRLLDRLVPDDDDLLSASDAELEDRAKAKGK